MAMGRLALAALVALWAAVSLSGCADPTIHINSNPAGAEILVDYTPTGAKTPADVPLSPDDPSHTIQVTKPGFCDSRALVVRYDKSQGCAFSQMPVPPVLFGCEIFACGACGWCCGGLSEQVISLFSPTHNLRFKPEVLDFSLQTQGQGIRVRTASAGFSVRVDGKLIGETAKSDPAAEYAELLIPIEKPGSYVVDVCFEDKSAAFPPFGSWWRTTVRIEKDSWLELTPDEMTPWPTIEELEKADKTEKSGK